MSLQRSNVSSFVRQVVAALSVVCVVAGADVSSAQDPQVPKPVSEGRLYNLTTEPFSFQMHRADGAAWTEPHVVAPSKFFAVKTPPRGQTTEIQGITGNGKGFIIIRYREPALGGYMVVRLPATNPANQQLQPTWYAVKDSNGITRLIQEPSIEQAQNVQAELQKRAPMSPQELEQTKHMLRANWVLTN